MPIPRESWAVLERRRQALIKRIAAQGVFITAHPSWQHIRCGNPVCKCATDKDARHRKLHLTWSTQESHSSQYVPVALHQEVLQWAQNYRTIKELAKEMDSLSKAMIRVYSKSKGKSFRQPRFKKTALKKKAMSRR